MEIRLTAATTTTITTVARVRTIAAVVVTTAAVVVTTAAVATIQRLEVTVIQALTPNQTLQGEAPSKLICSWHVALRF